MTRAKYSATRLARAAEGAAIAAGAAALALALQHRGLLPPVPRLPWAGPLAAALLGHLLLGPKQRRPVYLRVPGAMYAYAGIRVDRNAGCRGGCTTGATGTGKTLCCILPRLHSLCINEAGTERRSWAGSPAARRLAALRAAEGRGEVDPVALAAAADAARPERFLVPPWGGLVCGEKGNEWQAVAALLRHHGRAEDLCVLRTRPAGAPPGWTPPVRLNLLSLGTIPADTYAKMIVDTGLAVEEAAGRDEFFVTQARDKIAWGLRLTRAVDAGRPGAEPVTGLLTLLDILTVPESYRRFLARCTEAQPALADAAPFAEARYQLEHNYWNQPPEQQGGVRSTVYNFLVPFAEPEVAAVFCGGSTLDLRDIQLGKVVALAIPQKFALQRRYVTTLLKTLAYQIILERFDGRADDPAWLHRNVVLVEQDEWQRHAVRADCEVDIVREAAGAVYAATQSQNAVWLRLGGREKAAPLIANLRNRWICQAATEECAEESSGIVSGRLARERSFSDGAAGRTTNVSFAERPFLPRRALRTLRPFEVVFAPAEGPWLYRRGIAMPATPDGRIPPWWFGDWNPLRWAGRALAAARGAPRDGTRPLVPPWRASAPLRAQLRWLAGLDGTFIVLEERRAGGGG